MILIKLVDKSIADYELLAKVISYNNDDIIKAYNFKWYKFLEVSDCSKYFIQYSEKHSIENNILIYNNYTSARIDCICLKTKGIISYPCEITPHEYLILCHDQKDKNLLQNQNLEN